MKTLPAKPGRTSRTTEPMNAVDIAEMEAIAELDLAGVIGGCAACGCSSPTPGQQSLRPVPQQQ